MNSRISILLAAIGLILTSLNPSAHAFGGPPGGSFSNGSYFPNDGTFSAVVRGENLTGTVQFSTTAGSGPASSTTQSESLDLGFGASSTSSTTSSGTGGVGSTGIANIFYAGGKGKNNTVGIYQGNSQGSNNPQNSTLTVSFQTDMPGQGEQTITVSRAFTNTTTANGTTTNTTVTFPSKTLIYFDSFLLAGSVVCNTSNSFPNQKFQGFHKDGAILKYIEFPTTTAATPFFQTETLDISITGVRLSNTASSFATSEVTPPSFNEINILE